MPGVHHVALRVRDLERAERWWRETLDLPLLRRWDDEDGRWRSSWLDLGGGAFLALERCVGGQEGEGGWRVVALRISRGEREAWERRLAERGVEIERRSRWTLYFRDPEGNEVALSHHPEDDQVAACGNP